MLLILYSYLYYIIYSYIIIKSCTSNNRIHKLRYMICPRRNMNQELVFKDYIIICYIVILRNI